MSNFPDSGAESRRWCDCGADRVGEWTSEGKQKDCVLSMRDGDWALRKKSRRIVMYGNERVLLH